MVKPAVVVHTCNHSTQMAGAGEVQVQGQPGLHSKMLSGPESTEGVLGFKSRRRSGREGAYKVIGTLLSGSSKRKLSFQ